MLGKQYGLSPGRAGQARRARTSNDPFRAKTNKSLQIVHFFSKQPETTMLYGDESDSSDGPEDAPSLPPHVVDFLTDFRYMKRPFSPLQLHRVSDLSF